MSVTIGVVMGEDGLGLFVALLRDEPTWRFWDPVDECELNHGRQALKKGESSPRPTVGDCGCGPSDPGNDWSQVSLIMQLSRMKDLTECTQVPETVIDGSDSASMLGVAKLSKQNWGGHLSQRVAETEDESTSDIH